MTILTSIVASGLFVSLPFAGYLAGKKFPLPDMPAAARWVLYSIAGIALWSIPLALSAALGFFYPYVFGAIGWVTVAAGIQGFIGELRTAGYHRLFKSPEGVALAAMVLIAVGYNLYPGETIIGGRDMGVYATHAMSIANHHTLAVEYPWTVTGDTIFATVAETFPGYYRTQPAMTVQFAKLYPVWLAQAYGAFGFAGLIRLNTLFAVLGLLAFYLCCRFFLNPEYAFLALAVAALNPGQIWVTHVTLSEILDQMFVWGFLFLLAKALLENHRSAAGWAGLFFGLTIIVRVDSYLFIGLLFLAHALFILLDRERAKAAAPVWAAFYRTGLILFVAGVIYNVMTTRPYITDLLPQISQLNYFAIGAGLILGLVLLVPRIELSFLLRSRILAGCAAGLFLLILYGYAVRPHWPPFVISKMPSGGVIRDHREDTLVNLASYTTFLLLFAVPAGLYALASRIRERMEACHVVTATVWLGFAVLYCYNPSIAPDHFWAIRRFIPVIIPGMVLFGTMGIQQFVLRLKSTVQSAVFTIVVVGLGAYFAMIDPLPLKTRENDGIYEKLASLAATLPSDRIILSDDGDQWARWETPLAFGFDKKIVPLDFDDSLTLAVVRRWMASRPVQSPPVTLVRESLTPMKGPGVQLLRQVHLQRTLMESTVDPVPDSIVYDENYVAVYQVNGFPNDYRNITVGGEAYWGVRDNGFYEEPASEGHARWTNGRASLFIPVDTMTPPHALRVEIASTGPRGTFLTILANRRPVFQGQLPPGPWSKTFSLQGVPSSPMLVINLLNEPFVPALIQAPSKDSRPLGVYLRGITLLDSAVSVTASALPVEDYRSSIVVQGIPSSPMRPSQSGQLRLSVINRGGSLWHPINELGNPFASVRIGIRWLSSTGTVILEQRADLPAAVKPGETGQTSYTLRPSFPDGRPFPSGSYIVRVGMVQEGVSWFHDHGDTDFEFPVVVR